MKGEIFDIKRFAVHDGPGIRATAFLKGCPLDCIWCHNPEGKRAGVDIRYNPRACIRCGACAAACPESAICLEGGIQIERTKCARCGRCALVCPASAISAAGYEIGADELIREFKKEEIFFRETGGITLSGGDPLFQPRFAKAVLEKAKEAGCHTAIETCLYAPEDVIESLIGAVDLWIADIKHLDAHEHRRLTGVENGPILSGYELLVKRGCKLLTRVPVIPGATDSPENLRAIGRYIAAVNQKGEVELMFYNSLGESKYAAYGLGGAMKGETYSAARKKEIVNLMAGTGINLVRGDNNAIL